MSNWSRGNSLTPSSDKPTTNPKSVPPTCAVCATPVDSAKLKKRSLRKKKAMMKSIYLNLWTVDIIFTLS